MYSRHYFLLAALLCFQRLPRSLGVYLNTFTTYKCKHTNFRNHTHTQSQLANAEQLVEGLRSELSAARQVQGVLQGGA